MKLFKNFILEQEDSEKTYTYEELSPEAQKNAIENVRDGMYEGKYGADSILDWVTDDDYLFEPSEKEMIKIFGPYYHEDLGDSPMIGNNRKNIIFASKNERNYYLHCGDALKINNDGMFLGFLKIPPYFWDNLYYYFNDIIGTYTKIEFEIENEDELTPREIDELDDCITRAKKEFETHMSSVLTKITNYIDYEYEDRAIIDRISFLEIIFDKDGNPIE